MDQQQYGIEQAPGTIPPIDGPELPTPIYRQTARRVKSAIRQYVETILFAFLAALLLRLFVVSAYRVSSGSMEDSLLEGDYIFVNKLAYSYGDPKPGDIIIFANPFDAARDYIKRIAATEGQTVEIVNKVLYIDGEVAPIPLAMKNSDIKIYPSVLSIRDNFGPLLVPQGQLFVLGDNRDNSQDSRYWGCVDKTNIKGKAVFIYFSYEPDPQAPQWEAPYVIEFFEILFYNLGSFFDRARPDRIGKIL